MKMKRGGLGVAKMGVAKMKRFLNYLILSIALICLNRWSEIFGFRW